MKLLLTRGAPRDLGGVLLNEDRDLVALDDQLAVLLAHVTLEAAVGRIVLEHVNLHQSTHERECQQAESTWRDGGNLPKVEGWHEAKE